MVCHSLLFPYGVLHVRVTDYTLIVVVVHQACWTLANPRKCDAQKIIMFNLILQYIMRLHFLRLYKAILTKLLERAILFECRCWRELFFSIFRREAFNK